MTISKRNKPIRLPANDAPHALLTAAEARGEAAFLVLSLLLPELPQSMCKRVMVRANSDADSLGIGAITEEVESLFAKVRIEAPLR